VFRNYATQGIVFSLAIVICAAALMRPEAFAGDRLLGDRRLDGGTIVVLLVDIVVRSHRTQRLRFDHRHGSRHRRLAGQRFVARESRWRGRPS